MHLYPNPSRRYVGLGFRAGLRSRINLKVFSNILIHKYITWRSHSHEIAGLPHSQFSIFDFDRPSHDTATAGKARGPIGHTPAFKKKRKSYHHIQIQYLYHHKQQNHHHNHHHHHHN